MKVKKYELTVEVETVLSSLEHCYNIVSSNTHNSLTYSEWVQLKDTLFEIINNDFKEPGGD